MHCICKNPYHFLLWPPNYNNDFQNLNGNQFQILKLQNPKCPISIFLNKLNEFIHMISFIPKRLHTWDPLGNLQSYSHAKRLQYGLIKPWTSCGKLWRYKHIQIECCSEISWWQIIFSECLRRKTTQQP